MLNTMSRLQEKREELQDFHDNIERLICDSRLSLEAKIVMVAYYLHPLATNKEIAKLTNLTLPQVYDGRVELMLNDWLASPEG